MIRETFYKEKNIECKSTVTDLVTETDKAVEKMIFDTIRESYPDHWLVKYYLDVALNKISWPNPGYCNCCILAQLL